MASTLLTNAGRALLVNLLSGLGGTTPKYHQWGTSGAATTATMTALTTPAAEPRAYGTTAIATVSVSGDTYQTICNITSASAQTIQELGLFDAIGAGSPATGGNMFIRGDFAATPIVVAVNDSVQFTVTLTFA